MRGEPSPERDAVLVHGLLVIIDSHQEISQHPVQDAVALVGQGAAEERDPFFVFLFPTFAREQSSASVGGLALAAWKGAGGLLTEQLGHLHHGFGVVGPLGQSLVQQALGLLLGHRVLQAHRGQDGERLRVGSQGLVDVVGHAHSFSDPVGGQVTVNQTCQATAATWNSLPGFGSEGWDQEC